jgi:hypothetical protein
MVEEETGDRPGGLSLNEIDARRSNEDRNREGKSGSTLYELAYQKEDSVSTVAGKVTEVGRLQTTKHIDLGTLSEEGYTHYAIFRLEDRSTSTIVQDKTGDTFKIFSLGRNNIRVSHPVRITVAEG